MSPATQLVSAKAKTACRCGGRTVYFRSYNGESLCEKCFANSIIEKTKKTIAKFSMLKYGEKVGIGLSGGKDSASLLYVLNEITKGHGTELYAITIDEGIRGYREEAVKNAERLARELTIPILVSSYKDFFGFTLDEALDFRNIHQKSKVTSCAICGPLRRRSLDRSAEKLGLHVLATAHNLDDVLQTFYINLHSGDLERIKWLDPAYHPSSNSSFKLRRIKPFMEIYEQELAFFAYLKGLPFQSESCPYMNEGIRTEIRENLNSLESRHPGIKYSSLKTVLGIASGLEIQEKKKKSLMRCEKCGSVSTGTICSVCETLEIVANANR